MKVPCRSRPVSRWHQPLEQIVSRAKLEKHLWPVHLLRKGVCGLFGPCTLDYLINVLHAYLILSSFSYQHALIQYNMFINFGSFQPKVYFRKMKNLLNSITNSLKNFFCLVLHQHK